KIRRAQPGRPGLPGLALRPLDAAPGPSLRDRANRGASPPRSRGVTPSSSSVGGTRAGGPRPARRRSLRAVEAAHLLERRSQPLAREGRVGDEPVAAVADLIGGGPHDGHPPGLHQGEVVTAGRHEPWPRTLAEEILPARVVRGRIRATEDSREQGGRQVEVRGAALVRWPGRAPARIERRTSHFDLAPTLLTGDRKSTRLNSSH